MSERLDNLVRRIQHACPELTGGDIADALWLSRHIAAPDVSITPIKHAHTPDATPEAHSEDDRSKETPTPDRHTPRDVGRPGERHANRPRRRPTAPVRAVSIHAPAPPPLDDPIAITRALRPLRHLIPSRTRFTVNDRETARRIAEEGVWEPVLTPSRDRWLNAAVVVDGARSMDVWGPRIRAFIRLLRTLGAFRTITSWHWRTDTDRALVRLRADAVDDVEAHPDRVIGGASQITFVISDCVARHWGDHRAAATLDRWTRRSHVVVVQPLPETLWEQTQLVHAAEVRLTTTTPASPNARLQAETDWLDFEDDESDSSALPLLSLEARPLARWARFAMAEHRQPVHGIRLQGRDPRDEVHAEPADAREILDRFIAAASPDARRLARHAAASPVILLPIIRLLRAAMRDASRQAEAEVLLSGLLRPITRPERGVDPDTVQYDFIPGARQALLGGADAQATRDTLLLVSRWIEDHMGALHGFRAVVTRPEDHAGSFDAGDDPIARNAAAILAHLSPEHARTVVGESPNIRIDPDESATVEGAAAGADIGTLEWFTDLSIQQALSAILGGLIEAKRRAAKFRPDHAPPFAVLHVELEGEDGIRLEFQSIEGGVRFERFDRGASILRYISQNPESPELIEKEATNLIPPDLLHRIQADPVQFLLITSDIPIPWEFITTGHDVARWIFSVPLRRIAPINPDNMWLVVDGSDDWGQELMDLGARAVDSFEDIFHLAREISDEIGLVYCGGRDLERWMHEHASDLEAPFDDDEPRPLWFINGWCPHLAHELVRRGWAGAVVGMNYQVNVPPEGRRVFTEMFFNLLREGGEIGHAFTAARAELERLDPTLPHPYFLYANPLAEVALNGPVGPVEMPEPGSEAASETVATEPAQVLEFVQVEELIYQATVPEVLQTGEGVQVSATVFNTREPTKIAFRSVPRVSLQLRVPDGFEYDGDRVIDLAPVEPATRQEALFHIRSNVAGPATIVITGLRDGAHVATLALKVVVEGENLVDPEGDNTFPTLAIAGEPTEGEFQFDLFLPRQDRVTVPAPRMHLREQFERLMWTLWENEDVQLEQVRRDAAIAAAPFSQPEINSAIIRYLDIEVPQAFLLLASAQSQTIPWELIPLERHITSSESRDVFLLGEINLIRWRWLADHVRHLRRWAVYYFLDATDSTTAMRLEGENQMPLPPDINALFEMAEDHLDALIVPGNALEEMLHDQDAVSRLRKFLKDRPPESVPLVMIGRTRKIDPAQYQDFVNAFIEADAPAVLSCHAPLGETLENEYLSTFFDAMKSRAPFHEAVRACRRQIARSNEAAPVLISAWGNPLLTINGEIDGEGGEQLLA